ncbi:MAG: sigma-70 family RNA polymerase sigma factor [Lewinellaceae bacterium]|nr:sigma-70 family RNA polymerase sigma factor [Lewinellaceae bacterium]
MFKTWRQAYSQPVLKRGGTQEEIDEALCQIALSFEKRVLAEDKEPVENLCGYLVQCVLNAWRKRKTGDSTHQASPGDSPLSDTEPSVEERLILREQHARVDELLDKLGQPCQQILTLWASGYSMKEITQTLQLEDEVAVRKKKYKCLQKLRALYEDCSGTGN